MRPIYRTSFTAAALALLLLATAGCYPVTGERAYCELSRNDPVLPEERSKNVPMMRIGSLPHPYGPIFVNYGNADSLGTHSIRSSAFRSVRLGEASRGILYTRRAGFIDLAHTRNAADLTWNAYERIRPAINESRERILLAGAEPTLFLVHLDYPPGWAELEPGERDRLAEEISIGLAVRMGYVISSWHEVLTSMGFTGVTGIPESQSAFLYDDQPSHLVGAVAAGRAIRRTLDHGETFNEAMTAALLPYLEELGVLRDGGTRRAVIACRGTWWDNDTTSLRQVHLGMAGEPFEPLLIHLDHPDVLGDAAASTDTSADPMVWHVPEPADLAVDNPALAAALPSIRVTVNPNVSFREDFYEITNVEGPWFDLDLDGPALKESLEERFGLVSKLAR